MLQIIVAAKAVPLFFVLHTKKVDLMAVTGMEREILFGGIEMKHCINCGAEMQDDVLFCPTCGASQQAAQEQAATKQAQAQQQPYYGQAPQQPYYGQPQQPYAQPYVPQAQGPVKPISGAAVTGLVFSILTWVIGCYMGVIGIALGLVGLICSSVGVAKKLQYRAPGIAIAGLVIACVGLFVTIILTIVFGYLGIFTLGAEIMGYPYY